MILGLLFVNLAACCLIVLSSLWLVTDHSKGRMVRMCFGLIMCGAFANVFALWTAFEQFHPEHAVTWPPEAMLNLGSALLLARWALGSVRPRRASSPPG
jgi:hypothetical protein